MTATKKKQQRAALSNVFVNQNDQTPPRLDSENKQQRADRAGQSCMPFWVPIAAKRQLRIMAAENDSTQQKLMEEALNLLFSKYGKPPIA